MDDLYIYKKIRQNTTLIGNKNKMWNQRKKRVSLVEVETSHDGRAVTQLLYILEVPCHSQKLVIITKQYKSKLYQSSFVSYH